MAKITPRLLEQIERIVDARAEYHGFLDGLDRYRLDRNPEIRRRMQPYVQARHLAQKMFASDNGWSVSRSDFTLRSLGLGVARPYRGNIGYDSYRASLGSALRPLIDHPEYFKDGARPAAIVLHPYPEPFGRYQFMIEERPASVQAELETLGIQVDVLPCLSWYNPGATVPVLVTPRRR